MSEVVRYEQEGRVVTLTLNQPETRNAISQEMFEALEAACDRVNADEGVSCVILTGAGESFCSGGNVKNMRERTITEPVDNSPARMRRKYMQGIQRVPMALHNIEVPTIAAVNGHAVGAGFDFTIMCDIRIAADNAQFAESFLRVGLVSGDGGAWFLPKVIGLQRAQEMTYTCEFIKADKAEKWGLVNYVVPRDELMAEAMKMAQRIASQPPISLRLSKKLFREGQGISLAAHLEMAAGMQAIVQHTADYKEALAAFAAKRKPLYKGQ